MSHASLVHSTFQRLLGGALILVLTVFGWSGDLRAQAEPLPSIEERTQGMEAMPGFFNLYWDEATGSLFWDIGEPGTEFLSTRFPWALGSAAIRSGSTGGSCGGRTSSRPGGWGRACS